MVIAVLISLLVLLITPVLLIRFRKRWVAAFNLAVTNRITSRFANRLPGFVSDTRRSKVRQVLPDASERFYSARWIPDRAHIWTRQRVGQERTIRWWLPA